MIKCCFSCFYWDFASKRIPIDVKKKPLKNEFIEVVFRDTTVKLEAWDWETIKPLRLSEVLRKRICFYGKGIVEPWDECKNYKPKFKDNMLACQTNNGCEYMHLCPKYEKLKKSNNKR